MVVQLRHFSQNGGDDMFNFFCSNGKVKVSSAGQYIICKIDNEPCAYQRYCQHKQGVEFSEGSKRCLKNPERNNLG